MVVLEKVESLRKPKKSRIHTNEQVSLYFEEICTKVAFSKDRGRKLSRKLKSLTASKHSKATPTTQT